MKKLSLPIVPVLLVSLILSLGLGCSSREATDSATSTITESVQTCTLGSIQPIHEVGDLYLAGQPSREDFRLAKAQGIKTVINLRHAKENAEFDEKEAVESAGLSYVNLPWNGVDELTDDTFDATRELLNTAERPILMHCGSSNRVGAAWLPWRVLDGGIEIDTAVEEAKSVGLNKAEYEEKALDYISRNQK